MAFPALIREYTPGSCRNSRKPMRLPPRREMRLIPLHCMQSHSVFPIKYVRSLDMLDGTPESPQEHCHKMRRTLMSPQEHKIARCTPNQLEMKPISPSLAPGIPCSPSYTTSGLTSFRQLTRFPETPVSSL